VCGGLFLQLQVEHFSGYFFTDWNFSEDFLKINVIIFRSRVYNQVWCLSYVAKTKYLCMYVN